MAATLSSWAGELERALVERSAWAHLGSVTVVSHQGTSTLGGFIDRRVVPLVAGKDPAEILLGWRRSTEGRVVDRLVVQANTFLVQRLGPARRSTSAGEGWLDGLAGEGHIVALGAPGDLLAMVRASRGHAHEGRLRSCAADGLPPGVVALVTGESPSCTFVATISANLAPDGIHVVSVVDVKTRGRGRLERVDLALPRS